MWISDPRRKVWLSRPIRGHRRTSVVTVAFGVVLLALLCAGLFAVSAGYRLAIEVGAGWLSGEIGYLPAAVLTVGALFGYASLKGRRVRAAERSLREWGSLGGWSPVSGRAVWPWRAQQISSSAVDVTCAFGQTIDGLPVVTGAVSWTRDGLGHSVDEGQGRGYFAVVRLPRAYPYSSVQRRRSVGVDRDGENEFLRQYRVVLAEPELVDRLTDPDLQAAHVDRRVPPWTIVDDELYAVVQTRRVPRPAELETLVEQLLDVVKRLRLQETDQTGHRPTV